MKVIKEEKNKDLNEFSMSKLRNKEMRVVAYTRVSTDSEDQATSIISQQKYYTNKIKNNPKWTLVKIYVDNGISGTKEFNRSGFVNMIKDGINNKYDFILTKSVSRFARNTITAIKYVRILKEKGIGIYFEEENINTLDMKGEVLLTILSSVAQQEAQNISNHVKLGIAMKAKSGGIIGSTFCYGYKYNKETKNFEIDNETSKVVKEIFKLYLEGNGTYLIAKTLTDKGILSPKGNKIWSEGSISHIIKSEKYIGDMLLGKTYSVDPVTKKAKKNMGERDKFYVKNHHPAIIDRDTWDKVQNEITRRALPHKKENNSEYVPRYIFSSKIKCGFCGRTLQRTTRKTSRNPKYYCYNNLVVSMGVCPESKMIDEEILKKAFMQMIIKLKRNIKDDTKFSQDLKNKIRYARNILISKEDIDSNKFDDNLFNSTIKYIIIGDERSSFTVRFILKSEEDIVFDLVKKEIKNSHKLLEFNSKQIFYYMENDKKGNLKQKFVSSFIVTCEIDMGD